MPIILDTLEEPLNEITLLIQLRIKVMLNFEIGFIGDTSKGSMLSDEKANLLATLCFIRENCFTFEFYAIKKSKSRF